MTFLKRLFGSQPPSTPEQDGPVLQAVIAIQESGATDVSIAPEAPSGDDLALVGLCYAAKIGWLMDVETQVRDVYFALADEAATLPVSDSARDDLFDCLKSARTLEAALQETTASVPGGELFSVTLFRNILRSDGGSTVPLAWVANELPQPGLAPNLPWSAFLLLRHVWRHISAEERVRLVSGLSTLTDLLRHDGTVRPGDQGYLRTLFLLVTGAWTRQAH